MTVVSTARTASIVVTIDDPVVFDSPVTVHRARLVYTFDFVAFDWSCTATFNFYAETERVSLFKGELWLRSYIEEHWPAAPANI